jgi:hypothetical protein
VISADIIEARAREYLTRMAFEQAKARHQRSNKLRKAWQKAKAALVAVEGHHIKQGDTA